MDKELMRKSFMQDIIENVMDDTPRLIYCDWLEEQGEEARAGFIRLQIKMAEVAPVLQCRKCAASKFHPILGTCTCSPGWKKMQARSDEMLAMNVASWLGAECPALCQRAELIIAPQTMGVFGFQVGWKRGFPQIMKCKWELWKKKGAEVVGMVPIETVIPDSARIERRGKPPGVSAEEWGREMKMWRVGGIPHEPWHKMLLDHDFPYFATAQEAEQAITLAMIEAVKS